VLAARWLNGCHFVRPQHVAKLDFEQAVLVHLRAAGVPVAPPLGTDDGRVCVENGAQYYTLQAWLPSDRSDAGWQHARHGCRTDAVGEALAAELWPEVDSPSGQVPAGLLGDPGLFRGYG
jgi:hypothetical protein